MNLFVITNQQKGAWATQPLEQILDSEFLLCELGAVHFGALRDFARPAEVTSSGRTGAMSTASSAASSARPLQPSVYPNPTRPISVLRFWTDFRGFDSSRILSARGGILVSMGNFLEILSQQILVGIILVWRLGVHARRNPGKAGTSTGASHTPLQTRSLAPHALAYHVSVCPLFASSAAASPRRHVPPYDLGHVMCSLTLTAS